MSIAIWKRLTRIGTAAVMAATTLVCQLPQLRAFAESGKCGTNTTWEFSGSTLTISGSGSVDKASWSSVISKTSTVEICDGVTSLPQTAFYNAANIATVKMADSVTSIGKYCFTGCSGLKNVQLSNSLTVLPEYAFNMCISLEEFNFPTALTTIQSNAFYGCIALTSVDIPSGVKTIESRAFYGTNLKTVTLPDTLEKINSKAFALSCIESVTIPASVTYIGSGAFGFVYDSIVCSGTSLSGKYQSLRYITIYGTPGTTAESFAKSEKLTFVDPNAVVIPEHTCTGEWHVDTEPTCLRDGQKSFVCEICGKTVTGTIKAKGHDYSEWKLVKEPTCTEYGEMNCACVACGLTQKQLTPAKGHSYGEWQTVKEPTLTEAGQEERVCTECGAKESRTIPMLTGYIISASAGEGGTISPSGNVAVEKDGSQKFVIKAKDGYQISNVVVDGNSYGGINEYTFSSVTSEHTIEVIFVKKQVTPLKTCTAITVTPLVPYWTPECDEFAENEFKIVATINDGRRINTMDITKDCKALRSPSDMILAGEYGVTQVSFAYTGGEAALQTYAGTYGIIGDVVIALKGDGNYDGVVNEVDAIAALKIFVSWIAEKETNYTTEQKAILDVFENGVVDADDACKILRYFAKTFFTPVPSWDDL